MRERYFMGRTLTTIGIYLAVLVMLVDQGTKLWIQNTIMTPPRTLVLSSYLNFELTWNRGVTFGLLNIRHEMMPYVFIGIAFLIVLFLLNWLMRAESLLVALGLGLVMGGAIGNIMDRVRFGAVADFIDFHIGDYHWYAFNVADSAIVCGVILLLLENITKAKGSR